MYPTIPGALRPAGPLRLQVTPLGHAGAAGDRVHRYGRAGVGVVLGSDVGRCYVVGMTLVVTGSTGQLGGRVARRLAASGVPQRLLARDVSRVPALPDCSVAEASYADGPAVTRALAGADTVFMVSGAEHPDRVGQPLTFVDSAVTAGVRHLVYTSFYGAAPDATFTLARDHWVPEEYLRASALPHTFLRDNLYLD